MQGMKVMKLMMIQTWRMEDIDVKQRGTEDDAMHESISTYFIDSFERLIHRCTEYLNNIIMISYSFVCLE